MKRPVTMAAMLFAAACGENPVAPEAAPLRPAPTAPSLSMAGSVAPSDVDLTLDDVRDRLVPALVDARAAETLTALVAAIRSSVATGDVAEARRLIAVARVTADPNGDESAAGLGDPADLASLRLTLANLAAALGS
ncbi:MAG TPA: hypothetical protein VFS59_18735 [Gemmatimonadaceae bacterium]|nr:hypothetical protein [Gemmatimonadaceae bacterium]